MSSQQHALCSLPGQPGIILGFLLHYIHAECCSRFFSFPLLCSLTSVLNASDVLTTAINTLRIWQVGSAVCPSISASTCPTTPACRMWMTRAPPERPLGTPSTMAPSTSWATPLSWTSPLAPPNTCKPPSPPFVLCCAVLCCAVLCCAVLCCAVLCCAVLCCAFEPQQHRAGLLGLFRIKCR